MRWRRSNGARPFVRLQLAATEEAFEGILLGRWNGHYHLEAANLLAVTTDGAKNTHRLDGITAVREDRVLCYQHLEDVQT